MSEASSQGAKPARNNTPVLVIAAAVSLALLFVFGRLALDSVPGFVLAAVEGMAGLWEAIEYSPVGDFVAISAWAFPALESAHVIAVVLVVGTIMIMDLRLLGLAWKNCAVTKISKDTLPWTWIAFVFAVITGVLLFTSNASGYAENPYFLWKMLLIVLAGINMAVFHFFTWKGVHGWDVDCAVPTAGKVAASLSLAFWVLVVFCGRFIGFTLGGFF